VLTTAAAKDRAPRTVETSRGVPNQNEGNAFCNQEDGVVAVNQTARSSFGIAASLFKTRLHRLASTRETPLA
jgi:hypothetical protein